MPHGGARMHAGRKQQWYHLDAAARADLQALIAVMEQQGGDAVMPEEALAYALHVACAASATRPTAPTFTPEASTPEATASLPVALPAPIQTTARTATHAEPLDGYTVWVKIGRKALNIAVEAANEQDARQKALAHAAYLRERLPDVSPRARIRLDTIARQTGTDTLPR